MITSNILPHIVKIYMQCFIFKFQFEQKNMVLTTMFCYTIYTCLSDMQSIRYIMKCIQVEDKKKTKVQIIKKSLINVPLCSC